MQKILYAVLILLTREGVVSAQAAANGPWDLTVSVGARFRGERGKTVNGGTLAAGVVTPSSGRLRLEFTLGVSQLTAKWTVDSSGVGPLTLYSRETSFEAGALAEFTLVTGGRWSLVGGAGPVASLSTGCSDGGKGTYPRVESTICLNSFAENGTARIGGEVELLSVWRGARAALELGVSAAAHTIASGKTVSPAVFVGFRAPLH